MNNNRFCTLAGCGRSRFYDLLTELGVPVPDGSTCYARLARIKEEDYTEPVMLTFCSANPYLPPASYESGAAVGTTTATKSMQEDRRANACAEEVSEEVLSLHLLIR